MKKIIALVLAMVLVLSLAACGLSSSSSTTTSSSASTETKTEAAATTTTETKDAIKIRFSTTDTTAVWNDPGYSNAASDIYFRDELAKRSEGRYVLDVYPDGQLASTDTEALAGLKNGDFEITSQSNGSIGQFTDAFSELSVPFFFPSGEVARAILDGEIGADMIARAEADLGVKVIFIKDHGFRQFTTNGKEVKSVADFKGLKTRTQSDPIQIAAFEALGCAVTSIPFAELYTSLQQKVIDAQENPWTNIYYKQLYEVQSYAIETNHIITCVIYLMNMDFWNSLSAEDQAMFEELFKDVTDYHRNVVSQGEAFYKGECEKAGMTIYQPTAEELAAIKDVMVEGVYTKCEETMGTERWEKLNAAVDALSK